MPTHLPSTESAAELAFQESERRYRTLFDSIDEGFCVLEVIFDDRGAPIDYRFVEANPAFERHTGLKDAVGRTALELVPTLERRWLEIYGRVASTGVAERFVEESKVMGRWFDVEAFRVGEPGEGRVGLLFTDITDRRRAEDTRRRADERLHSIVDNIRDYAIYATDPDGLITEWTDGAARVKGYTADEVRGRHTSMFYTAEDVARDVPNLELQLAAREGRAELETWKVRRGGERFWAHEITTPIRTADGRLAGFTRISRDLTVQKQLENEREAKFELERDRREAAEAFVSVLSHELRTPVTSIYGTASLIAREHDRADLAELVTDIQEEADRLVRMIDDLLVLSRADRGLVQLVPEPILLQRSVPEIVGEVARRGPGVEFSIDLSAALPPVLADPTALRQVLHNLATNAAKYAGANGPITITAREVDHAVELSVLDRGPGLGPDPEQVFTLFYRAPHTARLASGTGIGLYVARELMRAMGGTIDAGAREGGGTAIRITLPATPDVDGAGPA